MPSAYRFNRASGEIRRARHHVGSVRRAQDGVRWVGRIGQHTFTAADPELAFREVAALAMGFANLAALQAANREVRARNSARRAAFRAAGPSPIAAVRRMLAGESLYTPFRPANDEELIARIQREAVENDETPMTAEQIRATWLRRE